MKLAHLVLLPAASMAFAPAVRLQGVRAPVSLTSATISRPEVVDEAVENISSKTDDILEKADSLVLSRVMRIVDHAPILFTLKGLTDKAGMAVSKWSINASPAAFGGLKTALPVPTWCFNLWAVIAVAQLASVAKSALADDSNELSQASITTTAAANFMATRAIGSANPLLDTGLTAVVAGYALRRNGEAGDVTTHNASMQLMSSFTTVLTVLGLVSAISNKLPFLRGASEAVSLLGVAAFYVMATRGGNGNAKTAVNAGVIGGMLYARIAAGFSFAFTQANVMNGINIVGMGLVAYEAIDRLRKAVMDNN